MAPKTGRKIDMERNYVIVTLCIMLLNVHQQSPASKTAVHSSRLSIRICLPVALRSSDSSDVTEEIFRRHFCLTVLTISYVDSYRDIDSYVTILPSLPT